MSNLAPDISPLGLEVDIWLRLWTWYHHGDTVARPAPVPEFSDNPWPANTNRDHDSAPIPDGLEGPWTRSTGRSADSTVYRSPLHVLRVARSPDSHHLIDVEALALGALSDDLIPRLVAAGAGWVLRLGLPGERPSAPGPWLEEMAAFALRLRYQDLPFLTPSVYPELLAVAEFTSAPLPPYPPATLETKLLPSHGDLHTGNLLINDTDDLAAVLDFERLALAPPERDVALWLTVLSGQVGLDATKRATAILCPNGVDPAALSSEILRLLEYMCRAALSHQSPSRHRTARYLVETFLAEPTIGTRLLAS